METGNTKKSKEPKTEELMDKLLKSFTDSLSPEEKLQNLAKKYVEMERENSRLASGLKNNEKRSEVLQREKDLLQKEYNKGVLIRDKIEQVCREQQKLMKTIKSENMSKIKEEEEKRKETQVRFQNSIQEIMTTLNKNNDENMKLKETNIEMAKKFKCLAEQCELREKQLDKLNEQMKLENQLSEAKLAKMKMEAAIENEILLKEKQTLTEELVQCKKMILDIQGREMILKSELNTYTEKYEVFQDSLKKSNDIFVTYKLEIEKRSKRILLLEKENTILKAKMEKSNATILDLAAEKHTMDEYVAKNIRQLNQLQKLCRTLQAERTILLNLLKEHNIERPPMPDIPDPEPIVAPPTVNRTEKIDLMAKNCAELKEKLAQLQGQMTTIQQNEKDKKSSKSKKAQDTAVVKPVKQKKKKVKNLSAVVTLENGNEKSIEKLDSIEIESVITENSNMEPRQEVSENTVETEVKPAEEIASSEPIAIRNDISNIVENCNSATTRNSENVSSSPAATEMLA